MIKCTATLLLFVFSSILVVSDFVDAATAQPSVPEFTLKIVARPFDIAPSATVNPYTGQTTVTRTGYHVQNDSIDVIVKNQPSTTYCQIQFKGLHEDNWRFYSDSNMITPIQLAHYFAQSNGDYTVISVPINSDEPLNSNGDHVGSVTNFPEGGAVQFQVRALNGQRYVKQSGLSGDMVYFDGETGDWSNTQTITIEENAVTPYASLPSPSSSPSESQNTTPTPNQSGNQIVIQIDADWVAIAAVALLGVVAALLMVAVALLFTRRKSKFIGHGGHGGAVFSLPN